MSTASSTLTLEALATRLGELERANSALREEHSRTVADLEEEITCLRAERASHPEAQEDRPELILRAAAQRDKKAQRPQRTKRSSRWALLKLGGAAAVATVAAGALAADRGSGTAHAAAAHADSVTLYETAVNPGNIAIFGAGTSGARGVEGTSDSEIGVVGVSTSSVGTYGQSTSWVGVAGISSSGPGVYGQSTSGFGGQFTGGRAPLWLQPAGAPGAPTSGAHSRGELYVDSSGLPWYCFADGTPGSWTRLTGVPSGSSGGALIFLSTPIRLLDTRMGATGAADTPGVPVPKYNPMSPNPFHLPVAGVSFGGVTIPTSAKALVGNCTVVNPAGVGDLAAYPDLLPLPNTAVMHFLAGQIVSNGITIGLGTNGKLAITALSAATDVIIDCQGFIM